MNKSMVCIDICKKFKVKKKVWGGIGRYAVGDKRCSVCVIYIKYPGLWCPCCGCRLRLKPRHKEFKAKLREFKSKNNLENSNQIHRF